MINKQVLLEVRKILDDSKAEDIISFVCRKDYHIDSIVIASGRSSRHINGISDAVCRTVKHKLGIICIPDIGNGNWTAIACNDTMIHIMSDEKRKQYDIDTLMIEFGHTKIYE